jgi:hypothetical protein
MLEYLFANKNVEKVIVYLFLYEKCNATELHKNFDTALDPLQKTLLKLEHGGLLSSYKEGRTRVFVWNPRYPFLKEIKALAEKVYAFIPEEQKEKYYLTTTRRRPRKTDKPL